MTYCSDCCRAAILSCHHRAEPAAPKPAMAPLVPSTLSKKPPAIPRVLVAAAAAVKAKSSASFLTSAGTAIQTSSSPLVPSSVVRPTGGAFVGFVFVRSD